MGGGGTRFGNHGFNVPKPLIEIYGKPFFYWATQSLVKNIEIESLTFVVLKEHIEKFAIDQKIKEFYPRHKANLDDDWQNFELMLKREKQMEKLEKWIKEKQADTYIHIDESFKDTKFRYDGWIK